MIFVSRFSAGLRVSGEFFRAPSIPESSRLLTSSGCQQVRSMGSGILVPHNCQKVFLNEEKKVITFEMGICRKVFVKKKGHQF